MKKMGLAKSLAPLLLAGCGTLTFGAGPNAAQPKATLVDNQYILALCADTGKIRERLALQMRAQGRPVFARERAVSEANEMLTTEARTAIARAACGDKRANRGTYSFKTDPKGTVVEACEQDKHCLLFRGKKSDVICE